MKQITMNDEDHVALISCRNHEGEIPAPQILLCPIEHFVYNLCTDTD